MFIGQTPETIQMESLDEQPEIPNRKKDWKIKPKKAAPMIVLDDLEHQLEPAAISSKMDCVTDTLPESENRGVEDFQEVKKVKKNKNEADYSDQSGSKWIKIWLWHTWISKQPSGKKKSDTVISLMLYFGFLIVACIFMFFIMTYQNTYTSIEQLSAVSHQFPVPDAIVCPGKKTCQFCPDQFQHYNFTYDVWWNPDMLNQLNISVHHMNILASTIQKQAFSKNNLKVPSELNLYVERAKELFKKGSFYEDPDYKSYPNITLRQFWNCTVNECQKLLSKHSQVYPLAGLSRKIDISNFDLNDLWYLIVKFPAITYSSSMTDLNLFRNQSRFMNKRFYWTAYLKPKMTWVNNAYCLLFKNDKGYSFQSGNANYPQRDNIKIEIYYRKMLPAVSWRYWVGNLTTQSVFLPHFQDMENISELDLITDVLKVYDYSSFSPKYTICNTEISILHDKDDGCREKKITEYTYIYSSALKRIHLESRKRRYSHGKWTRLVTFYPSKVKLITKQNVYSSLATFEVISSIFCLFLGTSVYQILLILISVMSTKWIFFRTRKLKIIICIMLLIIAFILFHIDLNDHLQPKYAHQLTVGIGRHRMPPITFYSYAYPNFFNYSKLQELKISLSLLQYIMIAGHGTEFWSIELKIFRSFSPSLNDKEDKKKRLDVQSCDSSRKALHKEYEALAVKLGIAPSAPGYHVLDKLSLDKCMLVQYCIINGVKHMDCCKNYLFYRSAVAEHNALVFDNSENFVDQDLGSPDIEIMFNEKIWFDHNPLRNYANSLSKAPIGAKYYSYIEIRTPGDQSGVAETKTILYKPGDKKLVKISVALSEEEIKKRTENKECLKKSCYGEYNVLVPSIPKIKFALMRFKLCGCYICFNNTKMKRNLEQQDKCCSPRKAIECLANPLLYLGDNPDCPNRNSTCSHAHLLPVTNMNQNYYCEKAYCSNIVLYKTNSTNCTQKETVKCPCDSKMKYCDGKEISVCLGDQPRNIFILGVMNKLDAIYLNLDLDFTKDDMLQYGCDVNFEAFTAPPCFNEEFSSYTATDRYKSQLGEQQGQFAVKLSRKSGTNSFTVNRATQDRSYNMLEIFGLLLGAYSLFVGLDLISVLAFLTRFMFLRDLSIGKRFLESFTPVEIHWMRLFKQFIPHGNDVSPGDISNENSSDNLKNVQVIYSKVCVVSAVILISLGFTISVYAGTSKLLEEKEFNLNIVEEMIPKDFPSFAVCRDLETSSSIDAQAECGFTGIRCWVSMKEQSCNDVFDVQLFTKKYFCWVAADTSRFVSTEDPFFTWNDFNFVITINRTFPYLTWYGHLSTISNLSEINPVIVNEKYLSPRVTSYTRKHVVHVYEEYRNFSCSSTQETELLCPHCTDKLFGSNQCCIYHQNVTTEFLLKKHSCPKISYMEGPQTYYTSLWLQSSNIWEEIRPHRIVALKRMHQYAIEATYTDRHSGAAKFALITGYTDLFLGISILSIGGSFALWCLSHVRFVFEKL